MKANLLLMAAFVVTLVSCKSQDPAKQSAPNDNLPLIDEANKIITVSAPEEWNKYKLSDPVFLLVLPISEHTVILNDHDLTIYKKIDDKWTSVENQNPLPPITCVIEPNPIQAASAVQVVAVPVLGEQTTEVILRIVVSGNIYDNKTMGKQVSAYVDVTLHP